MNIEAKERDYTTPLARLGWDAHFEARFNELGNSGLIPARVTQQHRTGYIVHGESGEMPAEVTGRFRHEAMRLGNFPAVGDWVAISPGAKGHKAKIHAVLARKSSFSRKVAGARVEEQVVAANMDTVFIVFALDGALDLKQVERFLAVARNGGTRPVIVLNKADLCADVDGCLAGVKAIASGAPVCCCSTLQSNGLDSIVPYLGVGQTVGMLGPSGVGKSSLINYLLGEERQKVQPVRNRDQSGRHTTTSRELIFVPQGAVIIDTPGMRELPLWIAAEEKQSSFDDIELLAGQCRFRNCGHTNEPGCAVQAAVEQGTIDAARLQDYRLLRKEAGESQKMQAAKLRLDARAADRTSRASRQDSTEP